MLDSRMLESRDRAISRSRTKPPPLWPQFLSAWFEATTEDGAQRLASWARAQQGVTTTLDLLPAIVHRDRAPSFLARLLARLIDMLPGSKTIEETLVFVGHRPEPVWRVTIDGIPQKPLAEAAITAWFTMLEQAPEDPLWRFTGWAIVDARAKAAAP